jgi:hypothetical protein
VPNNASATVISSRADTSCSDFRSGPSIGTCCTSPFMVIVYTGACYVGSSIIIACVNATGTSTSYADPSVSITRTVPPMLTPLESSVGKMLGA